MNVDEVDVDTKEVDVDDDVPPLEDCSAILEHCQGGQRRGTKIQAKPDKLLPVTHFSEKHQKAGHKKSDYKNVDYCGFRRGFLSGGTQEEVPYLKPTTRPHVIPEVQRAMANAPGGWLTESLLQKVESDESLSSLFVDPEISTALTEFITNEKVARKKYAGNKKVAKFYQKMASILGEHFQSLEGS